MRRHLPYLAIAAAATAGTAGGPGCGADSTTKMMETPDASHAALIAPETCGGCHPTHFKDWLASMHAKAADDPVFIAMNARGQRETKGELGTFCVKCHAPMAVVDKKTKDGLNLASLSAYYRGVTCYFCHAIDGVGTSHVNADVHLADDLVMRGEIRDALPNPIHASAYSTFHDSNNTDSAAMCGSCHDITTSAGGHIERTFSEWSHSVFSASVGGLTCAGSGCHMTPLPKDVAIATSGPVTRRYHPHDFPAVDVDLGIKPPPAIALKSVQYALDNNALNGALCVTAANGIRVVIDSVGIGHNWPSGAAQDRRAWTEVIAYRADGSVIYSSGVVPDGTPVTSLQDPDLWLLRDCMFDSHSRPVSNFWEASETKGYAIPPAVTSDPGDPKYYNTHILQSFPRANGANPILSERPARVTLRLRLQPIGLDVLNDLVASGDLDAGPDGALLANMPTFDVSLKGAIGPGLGMPGNLEWTTDSKDAMYTDRQQGPATCAATPGFVPGFPVTAQSAASCAP